MLKKLSLRQNLIEDSAVEPLSRWDALSDLEVLILRDNKLAEVPDISIFSRLLVFDVSFNEITSLEGLSKASSTLKELYNSTINTPLHLDSIELPPTLTDLDLTVNRLSELDSRIAHLSMLKKLSLRQNLIEDSAVEPLSRWDALSDLEELILRDNKLAEVPDISIFSRLLVFDVSFNEITSLEGLSKASSTLKELYVSKNLNYTKRRITRGSTLLALRLHRFFTIVSVLSSQNSTINTPLHLDSIELPPTLTDLDLTVNRLSELDSRIAHLSMLKKLSLRQNLIEDSAVEPFSRWDALSDLEELILRDNKLSGST
uniref:Uncharacterized protein n=1 Tax=Brassica oleracea TaxID=3712 RepID=A0A3P6EGA1_BRAOL|nr:unnamed protein product [Brassica oleracea]